MFKKGVFTIVLLILSNTFMTIAWYSHLKFKDWKYFNRLGLLSIILLSWGLAFFEYIFQVPANRIGFKDNGGPFNVVQLKVIQEIITLSIFSVFTIIFFRNQNLSLNNLLSFVFICLAVFFAFRG